jgi:hypothetical protein
MPFRAFDFLQLGAGDQVDIEMPADLDQFRRNNSHGTVVGWESLVQLAHHSAYSGGFLYHVNKVARVGEVKRGLHAANTPANHQDRTAR